MRLWFARHEGLPSPLEDAKRDQWFQSAGYRVFRVWNNDVLKNPNGVLEAILSAASADKG
jgi:very-short-patch-repair endonuclease